MAHEPESHPPYTLSGSQQPMPETPLTPLGPRGDVSPPAPENGDPPGAFGDIPPIDDGFPAVSNEFSRYILLSGGWRAIGASLRGLSHRHRGKYREDSFGWGNRPKRRDGSSPRSAMAEGRIHSRASVPTMRPEWRSSAYWLVLRQAARCLDPPSIPSTGRLSELLKQGLDAAQQAVVELAGEMQRPVADFYATLLLLVMGALPNGRRIVATAQVGDGAIGAFVRRNEGNKDGKGSAESEGSEGSGISAEYDYIALANPDEGAIAGGTVFLSQADRTQWPDRIHVNQLPSETVAVLLATDGVSDDFKPLRTNFWPLMRRLQQRVFTLPDLDVAETLLRELQWKSPIPMTTARC